MTPDRLNFAIFEAKKWKKMGEVEESNSSWCSAPVIVKKADGSVRLCLYFHDLNKVTIEDAYPLPTLGHSLEKL